MIFGLDSDAMFIGLAFGLLVGSILMFLFMIGSGTPQIEPPEIPDTAYDFCPRPGCTMADIHRSKSK